ncbi:ImmA/IrrE family metallo-endopeptidase [Paenibacillus sp. S-38]|uniref:ImmA/IrrE family metallo-endopeptidase n=1 Tax=Paenibacillus sp. S-38 TaxID=3416710 RepID=UPI003CEBAB21
MNLTKYQTTHLEDFVDELYRRLNVSSPEQLTVEYISTALGIRVDYAPISCSDECGGRFIIYLNFNLPPSDHFKEFLHELGHAMRHEGNQIHMHPLMREWQEWDAENFVLYASIPFLLLRKMELPRDQHSAIELIATTFRVDPEMAHTRYHQILRRIYCSMWR